MRQVFISHSSRDRKFAEGEIIPVLNRHGVETWYSSDDIVTAAEWEKTIREGLKSCDWFLVVISPRSIESEWVQSEVHWAAEHRWGRIIPVVIEPCDPTELHLKLAMLQYVDFTQDLRAARGKLLATWDIAYDPSGDTTVSDDDEPGYDPDKAFRQARHLATQIPGYSIRETLAVGARSAVFLANDDARNRPVAIKVLTWSRRYGQRAVRGILIGARKLVGLRHPAIVEVYEVHESGALACIVMEYIAGQTLGAALRLKQFAPLRTAELMAKVAEGIHCAHVHELVHRDLKPQNILMDRDGQPHVVDFELAGVQGGLVPGTLAFMAPEPMVGDDTDRPVDIWGLGTILYYMLAGERALQGLSASGEGYEIGARMQGARLEPPRKINPAVPRRLDQICMKCLERRPEDRYPTAAEVADELRSCLTWKSRLWPFRRRRSKSCGGGTERASD